MTEDQLETWMYKMIRACNRSTSDSDINVIKLIQHIENLYEQGRSDEREACAKLCEDMAKDVVRFDYEQIIGVECCATAIRARGEK